MTASIPRGITDVKGIVIKVKVKVPKANELWISCNNTENVDMQFGTAQCYSVTTLATSYSHGAQTKCWCHLVKTSANNSTYAVVPSSD